MPFLSRATLWMHHNQILTQHLTFLCGTMTLQHSTPYHALLNKPVVDCNCVHRILFQLNCQMSAEMHLFKPLMLVFLHLQNLTRVFYGSLLNKIVKSIGNMGFAAVSLSHYFCVDCEPLGYCAIQHIKQHSVKTQNLQSNKQQHCVLKASRFHASRFTVL